MLNRYELLFSIIGGWIASIIVIAIVKKKRGARLPRGSILIDPQNVVDEIIVPGYSKLLLIGMGTISFLTFFIVILCILDFWSFVALYIAFDLPYWINWIGVIGIWIQDGWGVAVLLYNVNYTPAYRPLRKDHVLATGGPYKILRHPMYVAKAILVIFFFLATGIWFSLLGFLSWFVLPSQAKREEDALTKKYGNIYEEYLVKTGRFFPKIQKK